MPTTELTVDAPCWIDLTSSDPGAVLSFYERLFGWQADSKDGDCRGYVTFSRDDVAIAGIGRQVPNTSRANVWNVYIATADADATVAKAAEAGGEITVEPSAVGEQGRMALVTDPGGALTGIWQACAHRGYGTWGERGTPVWHEQFTRDYEATLPFYETVFGWGYGILGDTDEFRYAQGVVDGDMVAGIMDASAILPDGVPSHWRVYFGVDDTDAAVAKVCELGGTVIDPAEDSPFGRIAGVADPLGARFQLASIDSSR